MPRHTLFQEVMAGTARLDGRERPIRLELSADLPEPLRPWGDTEGTLTGRIHVPGWADDPRATGTLRVAPIAARRIRYRLDFTADDGRVLHLDGWKSIGYRHPVRSMTYLPATITDADGAVVGEARLRFDLRHDLMRFLAGFRLRPEPATGAATAGATVSAAADVAGAAVAGLMRPRWRGRPGRLEVWYTTLTDPATGTGIWLHHELVAPADGGAARAHGWAAVFPPGRTPDLARFGPDAWPVPPGRPGHPGGRAGAVAYGRLPEPGEPGAPGGSEGSEASEGTDGSAGFAGLDGFACDSAQVSAGRLRGRAGALSWDLTAAGGGPPLFTFPRWAWRRDVLPAAQIVPMPAARYDGTVRYRDGDGDRTLSLTGAPGATARVYGHGNAERWAWLHAGLGDGDVCEVVAAVSARRGLDRLPPLPFVRLRVGGEEWPAGDPLLAAARMRARIGLPSWTVRGRSGDRAVRIEVTLPPDRTLAVDYADPDGRPAVCHNSERADAVITLLRRDGTAWTPERRWRLDGTAHAEVGLR